MAPGKQEPLGTLLLLDYERLAMKSFVPRLSGLENDGIVLSPVITLRTHIQDVVEVLTREDLRHITLVGHSYAGMIITGVAEQVAHRLDHLVYADAFIPRHGQCALDLLPAPVAEMFRQTADSAGGGWLLRAGEAQLDMWGLKPSAERDFVRSRMSDFSLRCFQEAINLPTNAASKVNRTFIACVAEGYPARPIFQPFGDRAKSERWNYHELATGHDGHVELPDVFVSKLFALSATA
jgi:pimeloyl-ACP methyl ester carboxylesterase